MKLDTSDFSAIGIAEEYSYCIRDSGGDIEAHGARLRDDMARNGIPDDFSMTEAEREEWLDSAEEALVTELAYYRDHMPA